MFFIWRGADRTSTDDSVVSAPAVFVGRLRIVNLSDWSDVSLCLSFLWGTPAVTGSSPETWEQKL